MEEKKIKVKKRTTSSLYIYEPIREKKKKKVELREQSVSGQLFIWSMISCNQEEGEDRLGRVEKKRDSEGGQGRQKLLLLCPPLRSLSPTCGNKVTGTQSSHN